ncbi:MAG: hypothetical protein PVJ52_03050 [Candidatus Woesebacteria bacterium]|jgi:hypothetical protein
MVKGESEWGVDISVSFNIRVRPIDVGEEGRSGKKYPKGKDGKIPYREINQLTAHIIPELADATSGVIELDPSFAHDYPVDGNVDPVDICESLKKKKVKPDEVIDSVFGMFNQGSIENTPLGKTIKGAINERVSGWWDKDN